MSKSSALRSSLNYSDSDGNHTEQYVPLSESNPTSSNKVEFPDFSAYGGAANYAVTSRLAGRINAANVSPSEHKKLLREREQLVLKKINNQITRKEVNRLEYIRWSLDRVEDARYGHTLDSLESLVEFYEKFDADLHSLKSQLDGIRKKK
jgi:hypothetical protein